MFETEVTVSMYRKAFRIKDIYLRSTLHREFYMSYQIEFYQSGEGGTLAQLSLTGPSVREETVLNSLADGTPEPVA